MDPYETSVPEELQEAERRLRIERVVPNALELDGLRRTIYSRAAGASRSTRSPFMKSRMTVTMMLVVGMLMSMSGAGLALSGSSGDGQAANVQYQTETTNTVPVTPTTATTPTTPTTPKQEVSGEAKTEAAPSTPEVKAAQQVAAAQPAQDDSGSLPFTGYSALPVLIGGLGVLGFGLMLRRRTREDS
jgi:hypothetical protein